MTFLRTRWSAALILAAVASRSLPTHAEQRTWSDVTGKFQVEAEFVEVTPAGVVLKNPAGKTTTVPLERLSPGDRAYIEAQATLNAAAPPADGDAPAEITFPDALIQPPAWVDAAAPFDVAAYLTGPPPQDNAAPLYLEALLEFSWSDLDYLAPKVPDVENLRRRQHFSQLSDELIALEQAWDQNPASIDPAAVDAWLANYDAGFAKLAAAQQRPACMFQTGLSFHTLLGHVQAARNVARAITWRARRHLDRGDVAAALADLGAQLRLARDLRARAPLVAQLVSNALDEMTCDLIRAILASPALQPAHANAIVALLAGHQAAAVDPLVTGNRAEYIIARQALHDLQHRTGSFDPQFMKDGWGIAGDVTSPVACIKLLTDVGGLESGIDLNKFQAALLPTAARGGQMFADDVYAKEIAALDRYFAAVLSPSETPDNFTARAEQAQAAEASVQDTLLGRLLIPSQSAFISSVARVTANIRGVQCLAALKRWQLEHAEAPADLAAIVTAPNMPGVPLDPFSGEPFRMATVNGQPVIYAIGPDGRDDQATIEWSRSPGAPGDMLFRLMAAP